MEEFANLHCVISICRKILEHGEPTVSYEVLVERCDILNILAHNYVPEFYQAMIHLVAIACDHKTVILVSILWMILAKHGLNEAGVNDREVGHPLVTSESAQILKLIVLNLECLLELIVPSDRIDGHLEVLIKLGIIFILLHLLICFIELAVLGEGTVQS